MQTVTCMCACMCRGGGEASEQELEVARMLQSLLVQVCILSCCSPRVRVPM